MGAGASVGGDAAAAAALAKPQDASDIADLDAAKAELKAMSEMLIGMADLDSAKAEITRLRKTLPDILVKPKGAVEVGKFQEPAYESPEDLAKAGIAMPKGLDDVTKEWMQAVLQHRGIIPKDVTITLIKKKGVGMTAGYFSAIAKVACLYSKPVEGAPVNFIVKAWPPFELLPKEAIGNMFVNDIKGYANFAASEWYPRPDCYLASWDVEKNLYALVLADADDTGKHTVHEEELTLDEVKAMIPALAQFAARFENVHKEDHPLYKKTEFLQPWMKNLPIYKAPEGGKPFTDGMGPFDKFAKTALGAEWDKVGLADYSAKFAEKYDEFWKKADVANGASCTVSHGDLRGDNLFFRFGADGKPDPKLWQVIDFQLGFKGPIPSDLAYLMCSGSVLPDVYGKNEEVVLKAFYDEFQKHTKAYKSDVYPYEKFVAEYAMMAHVLYVYYVSMGAAIWMSGVADGKLDPSKPDTVVGPIGASPELGSGSVRVRDLAPEDIRKRMWWSKTFRNFREVFAKHAAKNGIVAGK